MKTDYLPRLAVRVFDEPLLIRPRKLYVILQAIGPRLGLTTDDVEVIAARMPMDGEPIQIAVVPGIGTVN